MACTSGSVEKVVNKTKAAKEQIERLAAMLKNQHTTFQRAFDDEIAAYLKEARITDARTLDANKEIKTEYSSEFSLDKITKVIVSALEVALAATNPLVQKPLLSAGAVSKYTDLVNNVAEAAKSSSSAATSLTFTANRLAPGLLAFLYASSLNIQDKDTFGSEAVTTTVLYYRVVESIQDIQLAVNFSEKILDAGLLLNLKALQAALFDDLASGKINIDEWKIKDDFFSVQVARVKARLASENLEALEKTSLPRRSAAEAKKLESIMHSAIKKLSPLGAAYESAIEVTNDRLAIKYFGR